MLEIYKFSLQFVVRTYVELYAYVEQPWRHMNEQSYIPNLDTRWKWEASSTSGSFTLEAKSRWCGKAGWTPRAGLDAVSCPCWESNPYSSVVQLVT